MWLEIASEIPQSEVDHEWVMQTSWWRGVNDPFSPKYKKRKSSLPASAMANWLYQSSKVNVLCHQANTLEEFRDGVGSWESGIDSHKMKIFQVSFLTLWWGGNGVDELRDRHVPLDWVAVDVWFITEGDAAGKLSKSTFQGRVIGNTMAGMLITNCPFVKCGPFVREASDDAWP